MGKKSTFLNLKNSHSSQAVWGRPGELGKRKTLEMYLFSSGVMMSFSNDDNSN